MDFGAQRVLVLAILRYAHDYPWTMQDIGLLGLRLDERREYRLHVWDPSYLDGEPPIHDHPFDFTSTIVAGRMTNTRYSEDPAGTEYSRSRYVPGKESARRVDRVRLTGHATTLVEGERYVQQAHELHDSRQLPGTVTIIRNTRTRREELTVCQPVGSPWRSGRSRPATPEEVKQVTAHALEWF